MSRIKCPNCGSTSQPELVWEDRDSYSTKKVKEYECGCGCVFEVVFQVAEVNILSREVEKLS